MITHLGRVHPVAARHRRWMKAEWGIDDEDEHGADVREWIALVLQWWMWGMPDPCVLYVNKFSWHQFVQEAPHYGMKCQGPFPIQAPVSFRMEVYRAWTNKTSW